MATRTHLNMRGTKNRKWIVYMPTTQMEWKNGVYTSFTPTFYTPFLYVYCDIHAGKYSLFELYDTVTPRFLVQFFDFMKICRDELPYENLWKNTCPGALANDLSAAKMKSSVIFSFGFFLLFFSKKSSQTKIDERDIKVDPNETTTSPQPNPPLFRIGEVVEGQVKGKIHRGEITAIKFTLQKRSYTVFSGGADVQLTEDKLKSIDGKDLLNISYKWHIFCLLIKIARQFWSAHRNNFTFVLIFLLLFQKHKRCWQ